MFFCASPVTAGIVACPSGSAKPRGRRPSSEIGQIDIGRERDADARLRVAEQPAGLLRSVWHRPLVSSAVFPQAGSPVAEGSQQLGDPAKTPTVMRPPDVG